MSRKREWPILVGTLLITGGLIATGAWWVAGRPGLNSKTLLGGRLGGSNGETAGTNLSQGTIALVPNEGGTNTRFNQAKTAGITALSQDNVPEAVAEFAQALQIQKNAPETRIYFNNARIGDRPTYTIAVAVPLTSDINGSMEILRGVAQAQSDINQAGGINQKTPLKVTIADDEGKPNRASKVAQTLIDDADILGVVGHYASEITLATGQLYNQAGLVTISPISTSVKLSNFGPYVFRTVPSDYIAARALSDYSVRQLNRRKSVVFFNSQSEYSQSLKAEFTTAMSLGGGSVEQEFDLSAPDFSATRALAQAPNANVIFLAANTSSLDRALQVVQANQKRLPILAGDDVYAPKTLEVGGTQAIGMVVAVPWHVDTDPNAAFPRQAQQLWGAEVNWRTAMAYDATQALAAAIAQNPTRNGVQTTLRQPGFVAQGASGPIRFLTSGDRNATIQLVKIVPGSKSGFGWDFVPVRLK